MYSITTIVSHFFEINSLQRFFLQRVTADKIIHTEDIFIDGIKDFYINQIVLYINKK